MLKAASSSSIGSSVAVSSASSSFSFLGACSPSVPSAFLCQTTGLISSSIHKCTPQVGKNETIGGLKRVRQGKGGGLTLFEPSTLAALFFARPAGPQLARGLTWYRTSLVREI